MEITVSEKYNITVKAEKIGDDLIVIISGGDRPHIGSVSASSEEGVTSYTYPTHKDNYISEPVADALRKHFSGNVVVAAGIHIDNIKKEEIQEIIDLVPEIVSAVLCVKNV